VHWQFVFVGDVGNEVRCHDTELVGKLSLSHSQKLSGKSSTSLSRRTLSMALLVAVKVP
jgi:hypothetical protein